MSAQLQSRPAATAPTCPTNFLTKAELAERRRVSVRTVETWIERGGAPPYQRTGRRVLFPEFAVVAWEAANTHASRAAERARDSDADE